MKKKIITTMMAALMATSMIVPSAMAATPEGKLSLSSDSAWLIKEDGLVATWGSNSNGKLGVGKNQTRPVLFEGTHKWKMVTGDTSTSAAIREDGTLWTFGYGNSGTLGTGSTANAQAPVQVGTDTNWASVQVANGAMFALKTDGSLYTWGNNVYGILGRGSSAANISTPGLVNGGTGIWKEIFPGTNSVLGIQADGTLWSWGRNNNGQLGLNSTTDQNSPQRVSSAPEWGKIISVGDTSYVQKTNGQLWAWGSNYRFALGTNRTDSMVTAPEPVGGAISYSHVAINNGSGVAVSATDGKVYTWGNNTEYKAGDGSTTNVKFPVSVLENLGWKKVISTTRATFALSNSGDLYSWGDSFQGVAGHGSTRYVTTPTKLSGSWRDVLVVEDSVHAIATDGTLWGWGANGQGELGVGNNNITRTPQQASTDTDWNNMYSDQYSNKQRFFASKTNGDLYGAGSNYNYGIGVSDFNSNILTMTKLAMPVMPTTVPTNVVAAPGDKKVTLTWDASPHAKGYDVYVNGDSSKHNMDLITGTTYEVTGLTNGQQYTFEVVAVNSVNVPTAKSPATPAVTPVSSVAPNPDPGNGNGGNNGGGNQTPSGKYDLLPGVNKVQGNMVIATKRATEAELQVNGYDKAVSSW